MPKPRLPNVKADITGAAARNPKRFRGRSSPPPSGPVGDPPDWLGEYAVAAWRDLEAEVGAWVTFRHRFAMENASIIRGQIREMVESGELVPATMFSAANAAVGKLAASPVDESKVAHNDDSGKTDPADEFLN